MSDGRQQLRLQKWAVGIVSAILVLTAKEKSADSAALVVISGILFWFLDAYYLALEKQFRDSSKKVVTSFARGEVIF